jgi:hypothetical protein
MLVLRLAFTHKINSKGMPLLPTRNSHTYFKALNYDAMHVQETIRIYYTTKADYLGGSKASL